MKYYSGRKNSVNYRCRTRYWPRYRHVTGGGGANVVAANLDINIAGQTAEKVRQLGRKSLALEVDVMDPDSINKMVQQAEEHMGQLAVYLASAAHVTGQAIAVDGGFSL
ncbi:MAG: SDR family oxidoreductase [Marinobacter sp.]